MIQEKDIIKFGKQTIKNYNRIKKAISVQQSYIRNLRNQRDNLQNKLYQENKLNRENGKTTPSKRSEKISKQISKIEKKIQASKQEIKKLNARKLDTQIKLSQFNQSANKLVQKQGTYLDSSISKSLNSTIESAKKTDGVSRGKRHRHNKKVKINPKSGKMANAANVIKTSKAYKTVKGAANAFLTTQKLGSQVLKGTVKGMPFIGAIIDISLYRLLQEDYNNQSADEVLSNSPNNKVIDKWYSPSGAALRLGESIAAPFFVPYHGFNAMQSSDALQAHESGDSYYKFYHADISVSKDMKNEQLNSTFKDNLNESSKSIIQLKMSNSVLPNLKKQNDALFGIISNLNKYDELKINDVDILTSYINKNNANIINLIVSLFFENAYLTTRFLPQIKYLNLDIKVTNETKEIIKNITDKIIVFIGLKFHNIYKNTKIKNEKDNTEKTISEIIKQIKTSNLKRKDYEIFGVDDKNNKEDAKNANKNAVFLTEYVTDKHTHNDYLIILDNLQENFNKIQNTTMSYKYTRRFLPDLLITLICTNQSFTSNNIRYKIHYLLLNFLHNSLLNICGSLSDASFFDILYQQPNPTDTTKTDLLSICKSIYIYGLNIIIKYLNILYLKKGTAESFSKLSIVHVYDENDKDDKSKHFYMVKNDGSETTNNTFLNDNFKNKTLDVSTLSFLQQISSNKQFTDVNNINVESFEYLVEDGVVIPKNIKRQAESLNKYTNKQNIINLEDIFYYIKDLISFLNTTNDIFKKDNIKSVEILSYKESIIENKILECKYKDSYLNVIGDNQDKVLKQYLSVLDNNTNTPQFLKIVLNSLKSKEILQQICDVYNYIDKAEEIAKNIKYKNLLNPKKDKFKSNYPSSEDIEKFLNYKSNKEIENCKLEIIRNLFTLLDQTFTETLKKIILINRRFFELELYTKNIYI